MQQRTFSPEGETGTAGTPAEPAPAGEQTTSPQEPSAPDLSYIDAEFVTDAGLDHDRFRTHYEELQTAAAQRAEAMQGIPEDGTYDLSLPEDLDFGDLSLPEGFEVNFTEDEQMAPLLEEFSGFLKENNLPQSVVPGIMGMLAKYEARQVARMQGQLQDFNKSLASTDAGRAARVNTLKRAIEGSVPEAQAQALLGTVTNLDAFKALESILTSRDAGNPSPQRMTVPDPMAARYPNSMRN